MASRNGRPRKPTNRIDWELITPKRAEGLLATNFDNRNPKPASIERYLRDINAGYWYHEAGVFQVGKDGNLLNGQNRLMAIMKADKDVYGLFVYDVDRGAQAVMDTGAKRTIADALKIDGEKNYSHLATALRCLWQHERGIPIAYPHSSNPSVSEALALRDQYPTLRDHITTAARVSEHAKFKSVGALTTLAYLMVQADPENTDAFLQALADGTGLDADDPIWHLRNRLDGLAENGGDNKQAAVTRCALAIKAFNFWRQGATISRLVWKAGGARPEQFPTILTLEQVS